MKRNRVTYLKNILFPCVLFSAVTGILTGGLIFLFRMGATALSRWSSSAYDFFRENPKALPLLLLGTLALGTVSWLFLKVIPDCRGGGIPTSIGLLRGALSFRWLSSLVGVFFSSMVTFLMGIPLGTEGPAVQMGTAVGRGTVRLLGRRHPAWDRYVMTGGAGAGFAAATGAPLTGILFAFEEAHGRFSPMLLMVSAMTAAFSSVTSKTLFSLAGFSWEMFPIATDTFLPLHRLWAPVAVGILCGLFAVLFTKGYTLFGSFLQKLKKIPLICNVLLIFLITGVVGVIFPQSVGSGHHLIEELLTGEGSFGILILLLILRSALLIGANHVGITGGLFVPSLAFGALLGAIFGKAVLFLGIFPEEYYPILIIVGMCSFLAASSRTPLMAIAFALEVLCGPSNILAVIFGVALAYVIIEMFGIMGFVDTVVEKKIEKAHGEKPLETVDRDFTVQPNSFVVGKEIRDILWPPSCIVLSIDRNPAAARGSGEISEGDVLHLHYQTVDPDATAQSIYDLVGVSEK
ncbi:MAG: chloride channel protein [Clostridia bacterium]|nr:chloride channel protein [Clostridia bacterium]